MKYEIVIYYCVSGAEICRQIALLKILILKATYNSRPQGTTTFK